MEDSKDKKGDVVTKVTESLKSFSLDQLTDKCKVIEDRLFEFANFVEAKIALLYMKQGMEVDTKNIIERCFDKRKIVVLPCFNTNKKRVTLMKVENLDTDLIEGAYGTREPNPECCKIVPFDQIDIAIIPGLAFDPKGGRIGNRSGYYNKIISRLPITTRKVSIAFEEQVVNHTPTESKNKNIDIIVTDKRIIYKI